MAQRTPRDLSLTEWIVLALVADFLFLPPLLMRLERGAAARPAGQPVASPVGAD